LARFDALLLRVALGDACAFGELYAESRERLFATALRVLSRPALAEEALHDAYIKIWTHAPRYRAEEAPALVWMAVIVRNHAVSLARRAQEAADPDELLTSQLADERPSPEESVHSHRESSAVRACLAALQPVHRQVLALAFAHDMSHTEVARHVRKPVGTVKSQIRRGLSLLRESMSPFAVDARGASCR
jgi:RNA polymerase sigma-70 factor (ECF subfamily)